MLLFIQLALVCLITIDSRAQYTQHGGPLAGSGPVSISSDGNRIIIGDPGYNNGIGAAKIFEKNISGDWEQMAAVLTDEFGESQGESVAISGNGKYAIVGGPRDGGSIGAVWIYERINSSSWVLMGNKLVGLGAVGNSEQGCSVSINYDGTVAIVGGRRDALWLGAFWVFERTLNAWSQPGSKVTVSPPPGYDIEFGSSVSISADGRTVVVGAPNYLTGNGAAFVFSRMVNLWTEVGILRGTGAEGDYQLQGSSVAISSDGTTILSGGPDDHDDHIGAAWVFVNSGGVWSQQGYKLVGIESSGQSQQGRSVALTANGNIAMVGGPGNIGGSWVYLRANGIWSQLGNKLIGNGGPSSGNSVAMSAEGCPAISGGNGAAYIFECNFPLSDTTCMRIVSDTTYCDSTGTYIYEFIVRNNSPTKYIEQLEITVDSPQPPDYVVTMPSTLNISPPVPPLGVSGVQRVKLVGPGAVATAEVCYTLSAHFVQDDCPWCCFIENCIKLPVCGTCAEVIQDSIYCSNGNYYYNFTLQNGTIYDVTKIQLTSPSGQGITFVPQTLHFATPIHPGEVFPNRTVQILGGVAGMSFPIRIKLFSGNFECCYFELPYTLPSCNNNACDSASICAKTCCPIDFLTVCFAKSFPPYEIVHCDAAFNDPFGCAHFDFPNAIPGESYYVVVKSINSIETWSAEPQLFTGSCIGYDFTNGSFKAFGNNMAEIDGVSTLYCGDVNQDGVIDSSDLLMIDNAAHNLLYDEILDLNCDGIVDGTDLSIADGNAANFVIVIKP